MKPVYGNIDTIMTVAEPKITDAITGLAEKHTIYKREYPFILSETLSLLNVALLNRELSRDAYRSTVSDNDVQGANYDVQKLHPS